MIDYRELSNVHSLLYCKCETLIYLYDERISGTKIIAVEKSYLLKGIQVENTKV
jgi:hypothetical protein